MHLTDGDLQAILDTYRDGEFLDRLFQIARQAEEYDDPEYDEAWVMGDALGIRDPEKLTLSGTLVLEFLSRVERFCFCEGAARAVKWVNAHYGEQ